MSVGIGAAAAVLVAAIAVLVRHRDRWVTLAAVVVAVIAAAALTSCGSSAKRTVDEARARTAAEAVRAQLKAAQLKAGQTVRDMDVLRTAVERIPGSPTVTGLADANNDGKDDDGNVDIAVGKEHACVTAHDNGTVDVTSGAC